MEKEKLEKGNAIQTQIAEMEKQIKMFKLFLSPKYSPRLILSHYHVPEYVVPDELLTVPVEKICKDALAILEGKLARLQWQFDNL